MPSGNFKEKAIDLINRLDDEDIDWVLVGAEAMNLYLRRPRATVDVDIVVRKKDFRKIEKVLREICLELTETQVHWSGLISRPPMLLELDVIKSTSHVLFEATLDLKTIVDGVKAAPVECVLSLKYFSSVSPWRPREKKYQDVADFIATFRDNRENLKRDLLVNLASRAHANAKQEFLVFLDAVEHDKPITL